MARGLHLPWPCAYPGPWTGVWLEAVGSRDATRYTADAAPSYYCTHLVSGGRLRLWAGNQVDVTVGPGDLFSMWPGISWRIAAEPPASAAEVRLDWIRLSGPQAADYMRLLGTTEDRPWGRALRPARVRSAILRLQSLAREYPPQANLLALSILYQLAAACALHRPAAVAERTAAERIREAMEQHAGSGMNVEEFARAFRLSRSGLFLLVKRAFGISPIRMLTDIRLRRAEKLLRETGLSVAEVAFACGYRDPLYFSRQFRKAAGQSPRQMRSRSPVPGRGPKADPNILSF